MRVPLRMAALALLSGVTLGGCAYGLGDPYGGYGGVNVGYGNGYYGGYGSPYGYGGYGYGSPYGYGGYGGYGSAYGYGYDPFGWYGNYYYPGSGIYVYDRDRHRRVMTAAERQHWLALFSRVGNRGAGTTATTQSVTPRENWSGFNRPRVQTSTGMDATPRSNRARWQGRSSAATSSGDTTTTTTTAPRTNNGWRGRGHNRSNEQ